MISKKLNLGENIDFSTKKRFGIITLNRPHKANALTLSMVKDLLKTLKHCQKSEKIRGIILTGRGDSFTTGMDINDIDGSNRDEVREYEEIAASIQDTLYYGKPVICAINGKSMGDGVAYALSSDYRIAIENCYFRMPEINLGIFPGTGIIVLMSRIVGIPWTKKILMFAEKINTGKALEIGLIDKIVHNKQQLMDAALNKAKFLFTKNQTLLNAIKLCSNHLGDKSYPEAYKLEKIGSDWYQHENKSKYLKNYRKKFDS